MNDKTLSEIRKMKDGQNNYLWQPSFQQGQPSTLIAYPVATDDHMPDIGANAFRSALVTSAGAISFSIARASAFFATR